MKVKRTFNELEMTSIIKDLLCLQDKSTWFSQTIEDKIELKFTGNIYNVQKEILNWLNLSQRKQNIELLSDKE